MSEVILLAPKRPEIEEVSARELNDLEHNRAFNAVLARIDLMIESERQICEGSLNAEAVRQAQGALRALRIVKQVPAILVAEKTKRM